MRLLPQVGHAVVGWRIDDGGLEFDGARLYTVAVDASDATRSLSAAACS